MLGAKVQFSCLPIETLPPAEQMEIRWWRAEFSGMGEAFVYCGASSLVAEQISRAVLTAIGDSEKNVEGTYLEIIGQSLSAVAKSLSCDQMRDVGSIKGCEWQEPPDCRFFLPIKLILPLEECGPIWLAASPEFEALLARTNQAVPPLHSQPATPNTMDLLFDVELPVSVSFGRTQLALKDVIKLTMGSILELNRSISDPVELIVNNCVIARGEVVIIEGNYAIRIQQIISRQERLRTLY